MHSRAVRIKKLGLLTIRPLRHGDTETVAALLDRSGTESRPQCFNGHWPWLSHADLTRLATVDSRRHTLVAHVDGDPHPAAIAQLARDPHRWTHAEIVVGEAECYRGLGIGSTLVELLAADARAAGIAQLTDAMHAGARVDTLVQASDEPKPPIPPFHERAGSRGGAQRYREEPG